MPTRRRRVWPPPDGCFQDLTQLSIGGLTSDNGWRYGKFLIEAIASTSPSIWDLDVDGYTRDSIDTLIETARHLRSALPDVSSDILITKIMLGVFGCVPAFDTYFKKGLRVATFGRKSLRKIADFYQQNADIIEAYRVPTLDFATGTETSRRYTRAKVIDMIFFIEGGRSTSLV